MSMEVTFELRLESDKGAVGSSGQGLGGAFLAEGTAVKLPYSSG